MELLKSKVRIDENYKPSLKQDYINYFNRAMAFAQTNYHDELEKVARANFTKISPGRFFEEYLWCITYAAEDPHRASKIFPELSKVAAPYSHSFWDLNNFPKQEKMEPKVVPLLGMKKFQSIHKCADIISRGIKLFGWDKYRDNFLDCPERLVVLPGLSISMSKTLSRNIGIFDDVISSTRLYHLALHWGFDDTVQMCRAIQYKVPIQLKLIELILWYASSTFDLQEHNISET